MNPDEVNEVIEKLLSSYNPTETGIFISLLVHRYMEKFDVSKAEFIKSLCNSIDEIENKNGHNVIENLAVEKHIYNIDNEEYIIYLFPEDNNMTGFYIQKKDYGFISHCIELDMTNINWTNEEYIDENIREWIDFYKEDIDILENR